MKKFKFILVLLSFCFILTACSGKNETAEDSSDGAVPEVYYAKICYMNYVLPNTGHYIAYALYYDASYYQKKKTALNEKLTNLADSFKKAGYSVTTNEYDGSFIAELNFKTTEDYYKATGYDGFAIEDQSASEVVKGAFFTDSVYKFKTVFTDIKTDYKYVGRILAKGCLTAGIAADKVRLSYMYGTPYSQKMITSDADNVSYSSEKGIYLHEFLMTLDNCDRIITLKTHTPNTTLWYLLAVVAALLICVYPVVVYVRKRKKE